MHNHCPIQSFVILGGGTAGWMSAALLGRILKGSGATVTLIESPDISTVGVGEATVPSFVDFLQILDIPLADFMRETNATFKLGIKFSGWQSQDHSYWHPFGNIGAKIDAQPFFQQWLRCAHNGEAGAYTDYGPSAAMAREDKFYIPDPKRPNNLSHMGYALHFDAGLAAEYLKRYAARYDVRHLASTVEHVSHTPEGDISELILKDHPPVSGEFFLDCSGQRALLIEKALKVQYVSWEEFLPVNAAAVVQSEPGETLPPYTEAIAHGAGWRWRIPLQSRTGNGYVFCDRYCSDDKARQALLDALAEPALTEPRIIRFATGKRQKMWHKNCLAVGLSGGFLEPLESTGLYLIMRAILNFVELMPNRAESGATRREYNRLMDIQYENIRDFIVMHYSTSTREDTPFWRDWQARAIPDSLKTKLALYRNQGRLVHNDLDLFAEHSWYAVLTGMGMLPEDYDRRVDASDYATVRTMLANVDRSLKHSTAQLLSHRQYLQELLKG